MVRVEKPDEADQIRQLKKQIRQLQEALGKTQLENVMNESFLEIACEQLGVDFEEFKKKAATKRSTDRGQRSGLSVKWLVPGGWDDAAELLQAASPAAAAAGG